MIGGFGGVFIDLSLSLMHLGRGEEENSRRNDMK